MYRKEKAVLIAAILGLLAVVTTLRPAQAHFIIASWSFPDEYGQGIEGFFIQENSTGTWVTVGEFKEYYDANIFNWTIGVAIKLYCVTWFNSTLTGAATSAEGQNYQRHNVTMTNSMSEIVFSKQNFTYYTVDTGSVPPIWIYEYTVVLNFLPLAGEYYTVTVTYEIYW